MGLLLPQVYIVYFTSISRSFTGLLLLEYETRLTLDLRSHLGLALSVLSFQDFGPGWNPRRARISPRWYDLGVAVVFVMSFFLPI